VRTRLLALLLGLMAVVVISPAFVLARSLAAGEQQALFLDRLNDTTRFASVARTGVSNANLVGLQLELNRYDEVYGIPAALLDRGGDVRVASRANLAVDSAEARRIVDAGLSGRRGENPKVRMPWDSHELVVAEPVLVGGDVVGVAITVSPTDRMRQEVLRKWGILLLGVLAALVGCAVLALRITRWVLEPVHRLDVVTHSIATGQLGARVASAGGPPELRRLAASFNEMADNVEASVEQQRMFVADASHQLRNPLSALMLRLEQLGMDLPEQRRTEFELVRDEGRRFTQVLDELLVLARAERSTPAPEQVHVQRLVGERVRAWQVVAASREISLILRGERRPVAIVDPSALSGALDAVIDNALKFSPSGSTVTVNVVTTDQTVEIHVIDEGEGLEAEELERMGDRFWRSSRHQNVSGSGLGLSIARALLERCGGSLSAEPTSSKPDVPESAGLVMTLTVPKASPVRRSRPAARRRKMFDGQR
jgi:signal transduction histidine kinase